MARRQTRWILLGVGLVLLLQLLLSQAWPRIDDNDPPPRFEQQLGVAAAVIAFALPHVVAAIARRRNRRFFTLAGLMAVLLTLTSVISPFTMILSIPLFLIPGAVYLDKGLRATDEGPAPTGALTGICLVLTFGAIGAFFLTQDPRCTILVERDGR
ncbi:MAG: hypothetical protein ACR2KQ_11195 [Actinomycetota bacterium]